MSVLQIPRCGFMELVEKDSMDWSDPDPRGFIIYFEPPNTRAYYAVGVDPTVGIVNWDRHLRTLDDYRTDNGAIEVIRSGKPDVQVAEYAAPIDPEDLADVTNFMGRLYCGNAEDAQAMCIIEVYPGPGLLTQRKLINQYHYYNLFVWKYLDSLTSKPTNSLGWTSTPKSVRDLWIRCTRHVKRGNITLYSPYLMEEMDNVAMRPDQLWGEAIGGKHDDRIRALYLAIWAARDWGVNIDLADQDQLEVAKPKNHQASDASVEDMYAEWEDAWERLMEGT